MILTIDQREIEARDGETVLQAATRHGIDIPHFCYHDKLSIAGSCRMCLVKVNGLPKLQPACNVVVAPKMSVETKVADVAAARVNVLQFILLNHPVDCGICDKAGECRLQEYQHRYGPSQTRSVEPKHTSRKLHDLSPRISLDNERCILCSRCVRFTREVSRSNALGIVERGSHSYVERLADRPFDDPYSDNVIDLCPVGALLSKDFLYECRVWFLEPVRSVCTGCARACSVNAWRRKKEREPRLAADRKHEAHRITAFDNPDINGPWLCNKGFDLHKAMARPRLSAPQVAGRPVTLGEAVAAARRVLADARQPAVLVSTHASNEELDAFRSLLGSRFTAYAHRDCLPAAGEVLDDHLLIRADKNPNRHGVEARFGTHGFDATAGHDAVLVWGGIDGPLPFAGIPFIHLSPFGSAAEGAAVAIPVSNTFERSGTFSNCDGKENRFERVLDRPAHVVHATDVFESLAS